MAIWLSGFRVKTGNDKTGLGGYMRALNADDSLVPFDVPGFVGNYTKVDGFIVPGFDVPGSVVPGFVASPA